MESDEKRMQIQNEMNAMKHAKQMEMLETMTRNRDEALLEHQQHRKSVEEERRRFENMSKQESELLAAAKEEESTLLKRNELLARQFEMQGLEQNEAAKKQRHKAEEMQQVMSMLRKEMKVRDQRCATQELELESRQNKIEEECERLTQLGKALSVTEQEMLSKEQDAMSQASKDYGGKEHRLVEMRDHLRSELETKTSAYDRQIENEEQNCNVLSKNLQEMREEIRIQRDTDATLRKKAMEVGRKYSSEMGMIENLRRAKEAMHTELWNVEQKGREMEERFEAQKNILLEENEASNKQLRRRSIFVKERATETRSEIRGLEIGMRDMLEELRKERQSNRASREELHNIEKIHREEKIRLIDLEKSREELHAEWLEAREEQEKVEHEMQEQEIQSERQNALVLDMTTQVESMKTEMATRSNLMSLQTRREVLLREIDAAKHTKESLEKLKNHMVISSSFEKISKSSEKESQRQEDSKVTGTKQQRRFTVPEIRIPSDIDTWSDSEILKFMSRALEEIRVQHVRFTSLLVEGLTREIKVLDDYPLLTRNLLMISAAAEILMELVSRHVHRQYTYLGATLLFGPFDLYVGSW